MKYVNKNGKEFNEMSILVNEVDEITEKHEFSQRYERRKKMLLKKYSEDQIKNRKRTPFRVTAAVAAVCIMGTAGVYAAVSQSDFFSNAFGNSGRESVTAHIEVQDNGKKGGTPVQVPAREYVSVNPDTARAYLGGYCLEKPVVKQIGEHTLTILSAVRDESSMVLEFTLERKGGENSLVHGNLTNKIKGDCFSEDSTFYFQTKNGEDCFYVDEKKSTDEKLYCYDYVVFNKKVAKGKQPALSIFLYDKPFLQAEDNELPREEILQIPVSKVVPTLSYKSEKGGVIEISAIGMNLDMGKGLGLTGDAQYDPGEITSIVVKYKDGSEYIVEDENAYNVGYSCGFGRKYKIAFNRLVETDKIKTVEVNGIAYVKQ